MKDTEFIELLNLYLDHELTPADCTRLEAEVKTNPARRRVYEQYCRMQQACKVLATDFAAEAPAVNPRSIRASGSAVGSRKRPVGLFAFGSLAAAAACVAFVLLSRSNPEGNPSPALAEATTTAPASSVVAVEAAPRSGGIVQRPSLMGESFFLTRAPVAGETVAPQLAWINGVQISPMQPVVSADDLRFEAKLIKLNPDARVINPLKKAGDNVIERAAFEFRP